MIMYDPSELRCSDEQCRTMAQDGDDLHLKVALVKFEQEATALERRTDGATKDLNK